MSIITFIVKFVWKYKWMVKSLPNTESDTAMWIVVICSIILPGIGTMIGAFIGDGKDKKYILLVGFMQLISAPCLVGVIWSWLWAFLVYKKEQIEKNLEKKFGIFGKVANKVANAVL